MNRTSILPLSSTDFWIKRWFFGVAVSSALLFSGILSIALRHSFLIAGDYHKLRLIEVFGFQAMLAGIGYLGFALALFSHAFAPYSKRWHGWSEYGTACGLIFALAGLGWCSWLILAR